LAHLVGKTPWHLQNNEKARLMPKTAANRLFPFIA
jgi:hypothetical protein